MVMPSNTQTPIPAQAQTLQLYANRLRDELASVEQALAQLASQPPEEKRLSLSL